MPSEYGRDVPISVISGCGWQREWHRDHSQLRGTRQERTRPQRACPHVGDGRLRNHVVGSSASSSTARRCADDANGSTNAETPVSSGDAVRPSPGTARPRNLYYPTDPDPPGARNSSALSRST